MTPGISETYAPSDDTMLLIRALSGEGGGNCLEIGFGSGAVLRSLAPKFELAVGTDVTTVAQALVARGSADLCLADRASCFRDSSFDLVAFNPPYLPSENTPDRAVDGGPTGVEVAIAFLDDALRVLKPGGRVVALLSDRGDLARFASHCEALGLELRESERERLFYESLVVYEIRRTRPPGA